MLPLTFVEVNNLSETVTEEMLYKQFIPFGCICSFQLLQKMAYISYYDSKDAEEAVKTLNHTRLEETSINVLFSSINHQSMQYQVGAIVVKNLNKSIDEDDLKLLFSPYGKILHCTVARDTNNISKRYASIHFLFKKSSQNATFDCNGIILNGYKIDVEQYEAHKKSLNDTHTFATVFVENFGYMSEEDLEKLFVDFGPITTLQVLIDCTFEAKRIAFVTFANCSSAQKALSEMNGKQLPDGTVLFVGMSITEDKELVLLNTQKIDAIQELYTNIYFVVQNLDGDLSDEQLYSEFDRFGRFQRIEIVRDVNRTYACLCCANAHEAYQIINEIAKDTVTPKCEFRGLVNDFNKIEVTDKPLMMPVIAKGALALLPGFFFNLTWEVAVTPYRNRSQKWKVYQVFCSHCDL